MKNILVLENVSDLDANFNKYLKTYHSDDNVNIIYNLSTDGTQQKFEELYRGLAVANELVVCSSFADHKQLLQISAMLLNFKNITDVKILYLYSDRGDNKFIDFLTDLEPEIKPTIIALSKQCTIHEICCATYELESTDMFRKFKYTFDIVPIYYNEKHDLFWHTRQPVTPNLNAFLYKEQGTNKTLEELKADIDAIYSKFNGKAIYTIDQKYAKPFVELLFEIQAVVQHQIELCEEKDFGDSKKLIEEKKIWLKILENIKKI